jgi:hypothetical protein
MFPEEKLKLKCTHGKLGHKGLVGGHPNEVKIIDR